MNKRESSQQNPCLALNSKNFDESGLTLMDIPTQLYDVISRLSPEESEEMLSIAERLAGNDTEIESLIKENLDSLIQVLVGDSSNALV